MGEMQRSEIEPVLAFADNVPRRLSPFIQFIGRKNGLADPLPLSGYQPPTAALISFSSPSALHIVPVLNPGSRSRTAGQ